MNIVRHRNNAGPPGKRVGPTRLVSLLLIALTVPLLAGCFGGGSKERKAALTTTSQKSDATPPGGPPSQGGPVGPPSQHVPTEAKSAARADIAQREDVPASQLDLASATKVTLPLQGATAYQIKFTDTEDNSIYGAAVDANGDPVNLNKLLANEQQAQTAKYGKLDPSLAERVKSAGSSQVIPVTVIPQQSEYTRPPRPEASPVPTGDKQAHAEANAKALAARTSAQVKASVHAKSLTDPLLDRILRLDPHATADPVVPQIYASLTPSEIESVSKFPDVERIALSRMASGQLETAKPTVGADYVNNTLGITGVGVKVGEVEVGGKVDTSNSLLGGNVSVDSGASLCYPSAFPPHSTGVAGIIHAPRGIAPGTSLLATGDCTGDLNRLESRASYAASTWGATVENHSWANTYEPDTKLNDADWYFDNLSFTTYSTLVFAAANEGQKSGWVMSPGRAYNVITVGNYDDKGTASSWTDDSMSPSSSWINPYSWNGDREKPEVAAPGENSATSAGTSKCGNPSYYCNFHSTVPLSVNSSGWGSIGEGTSYAAPVVSGEAALLQQRQPTLKTWPEIIKAIIMATAVGNPDGLSPNYTPGTDKKDGAGGIWAPYADSVARTVNGNWKGTPYTCTTTSPLSFMTMSLAAGRATRAAIVWDQNPQYAYYSSQPSADLDLQVIGPSGNLVASSASYDNTYELVSFTPSSSGTYTMRVTRHRCDLTPSYLGGAWSQP